jgi:hypothetical protein
MTHTDFLPIDSEMTASTSLAWAFLLSATISGLYFYDFYGKYRELEKKVNALEYTVTDTEALQETQTNTLVEHNERIREKKDYDETEEIQEGKYQAWSGFLQDSTISFTVSIWREKYSTVKKNLEWLNWNKTPDGSTIVRDFYLGNSNPDFSWIISSTSQDTIQAEMLDTLINGWDSVCKIKLSLVASNENLLHFVSQQEFEGSKTINLVVKKCVEDKLLKWSRILRDA